MDFFNVPVPWFVAAPAALLATLLLVEALRRGHVADAFGAGWIAPLAALLICFVGWSLGPKLGADFQVRFLSSAPLTLLFGYVRALTLLTLIVLAHGVWHFSGATAFGAGIGINLLLHAILPVWLMAWLCGQVKLRLPRNPLCFMLGCGLFCAFITLCAQWSASAALVLAFAPERAAGLINTLPYSLLFSWGEAFMGGMVITVLSVFHPESVALYDEAHYLPAPPPAGP